MLGCTKLLCKRGNEISSSLLIVAIDCDCISFWIVVGSSHYYSVKMSTTALCTHFENSHHPGFQILQHTKSYLLITKSIIAHTAAKLRQQCIVTIVCSNWECTITHCHNSHILSRISTLEVSFALHLSGCQKQYKHNYLSFVHEYELENCIVKIRIPLATKDFNTTYKEVL